MTKRHACHMTFACTWFEHTRTEGRAIRARSGETTYPIESNVEQRDLSVAVIKGNKFHVIQD